MLDDAKGIPSGSA